MRFNGIFCTQEFVKAVIAYQQKVNSSRYVPKPVKLDPTWTNRMSLDTSKELGIEAAAKAAYLEVIILIDKINSS